MSDFNDSEVLFRLTRGDIRSFIAHHKGSAIQKLTEETGQFPDEIENELVDRLMSDFNDSDILTGVIEQEVLGPDLEQMWADFAEEKSNKFDAPRA